MNYFCLHKEGFLDLMKMTKQTFFLFMQINVHRFDENDTTTIFLFMQRMLLTFDENDSTTIPFV